MGNVAEVDVIFLYFARREQFGPLEAIAIARPNDTDHPRAENDSPAVGIHIDDRGGEIGITGIARGMQLDTYLADDLHGRGKYFTGVYQHVVSALQRATIA